MGTGFYIFEHNISAKLEGFWEFKKRISPQNIKFVTNYLKKLAYLL